MSGIRPPVCSKLAKNQKHDNDVIIFRYQVNVKFFSNSYGYQIWHECLKATKFQGYSFYHFWVIKGKLTGGRVKLPPPPRLGLNLGFLSFISLLELIYVFDLTSTGFILIVQWYEFLYLFTISSYLSIQTFSEIKVTYL